MFFSPDVRVASHDKIGKSVTLQNYNPKNLAIKGFIFIKDEFNWLMRITLEFVGDVDFFRLSQQKSILRQNPYIRTLDIKDEPWDKRKRVNDVRDREILQTEFL